MTNRERFEQCEFDEGRFNVALEKLAKNVADRARKEARQSLCRFDMTNRVRHLVAFEKAAEKQQCLEAMVEKLREVA